MTRLLLIRHGESVLGAQKRYAGHLDTPLTPRGRRQVLRLRSRLAKYRIHRSYSSDLARCRETAELLRLTPILSSRLREVDFGRWEGLTSAECELQSPSSYRRWIAKPEEAAPPRGESLRSLRRRIQAFVREIVRNAPGATVAVVTHGGPIRAILSDDFWSIPVRPASLHVWKPAGAGR